MGWPLRLAIRVVALAVIFWLVERLVPGLRVVGGPLWLIAVAAIFSVVNAILGPVLRLISLPLVVVTLGLFLIVVNAVLLYVTAALTSHLQIEHFWSALVAGVLIAFFSWIAELLLPLGRGRRRRL